MFHYFGHQSSIALHFDMNLLNDMQFVHDSWMTTTGKYIAVM